ncbi:MAG: ATP-binding protein [Elusimicrobiota bacterium]|nr:ATP-binding protein [Elusimicrobiota bacterium]
MQRHIMQELIKWKNKENHKPLVLYGARQVGKTWLAKTFGQEQYKNTVYINFDNNPTGQQLFSLDFDTKRIIEALEQEFKTKILPAETLLIFDEVQECNPALNSLKYFCENASQYHIVAAGSLLGIASHLGDSFPVGKVNSLTINPMTFKEFLIAIGYDKLANAIENLDYNFINGLKIRTIELLKQYFFVGGMPEAVLAFAQNQNYEEVRQIQNEILQNYAGDFSKHIASSDIPKVRLIWQSLPAQLAKDNNKFLYKELNKGARAREYENAIQWLVDSGLAMRVNRVSAANIPLISYMEREHFKLYMFDVGLLSAKAKLEIDSIMRPNNDIFIEFKGSLTEQFVLQELKAAENDIPVFYWTNDRNSSEIDFIIQKFGKIVPIEAKAQQNLRAKSLKAFMDKNLTQIALRTSLADYKKTENLYDIPLYMLSEIDKMIADN